ncbi:hypothetical protein Scep_011865 [Stephania cephalantha]|uniref:Uncharacterized protein n=1 Tax=Stephania cephalantha TaxID=152367 RepID=A0AAP0P5Z9_9MAGN
MNSICVYTVSRCRDLHGYEFQVLASQNIHMEGLAVDGRNALDYRISDKVEPYRLVVEQQM